jgi:2-polyprenyl-3-methyl-5-hydroxy-6-metoxy-1,4-benzoquinol methylase
MASTLLQRGSVPVLRHNAKMAARYASRAFSLPRYRLRQVSNVEPDLEHPVCQLVTSSQFASPVYDEWCALLGEHKRINRKQWEFIFILQALREAGALRPGARALGFGVGEEPLPSVLARFGCDVLATDLAPDDRVAQGWARTGETAAERLWRPQVVARDDFAERVRFEALDMRDVPAEHLGRYDVVWSACSLEHLGSIEAGIEFVLRSLQCLRPGGIAVHTTEFNLTSDRWTIPSGATVLYRKRDIQRLLRRAAPLARPAPFNDCCAVPAAPRSYDRVVDAPPYDGDVHLKIHLRHFVSTSIGLIFRRRHER